MLALRLKLRPQKASKQRKRKLFRPYKLRDLARLLAALAMEMTLLIANLKDLKIKMRNINPLAIKAKRPQL